MNKKSKITRRDFIYRAGVTTAGAMLLPSISCGKKGDKPNILWITCEDASPNLGCYGDPYAITPNLDRLAERGFRFTNAYSHAGVCAPSRSGLITGMYPSSIGSHHMRCLTTLPDMIKCFPEYLRQAGYYCSNNVKTDYNFEESPQTWDESSRTAHWRNRSSDQPFFSVFNFVETHESKYRAPEDQFHRLTRYLTPEQRHAPMKATIPPYMPDTPLIRREWARYNDLMTAMDYRAGELLDQLKEDGLDDNTIVFFFSDQGVGLPRTKQWIYDSGMKVPLIVYFPEKYRHLAPGIPGSTVDQLISFVDLAPTVLNLAGVRIPDYIQGKPFLGKKAAEPRKYVYGIRDRMDERYDMVRAVRDKEFKYYRNYMPHLPHWPWLEFMERLDTSKEWRRLDAEGKLDGAHAFFIAPAKPVEELYDIQNDPDELNNLAADPQYADVLNRMRKAHLQWVKETRDLGLLPEQEMRERAKDSTEYEYGRSDDYNLDRILDAALLVGQGEAVLQKQIDLLDDEDSAVRFWAATGLTNQGQKARVAASALKKRLSDPVPEVRIAAAETLSHIGYENDALSTLVQLLEHDEHWVRVYAANILDRMGERARPALEQMRKALKKEYPDVKRINLFHWPLEHAIRNLES